MDTKMILEYYGIACAILLPLCLVLIIVFARKGGLIERLNKWLDQIISKKDATDKDNKPEKTSEKKSSPWEEYSKTLTCLRLKVGDTYMCILNDEERNTVGSRRDWIVLNPFVGEINEQNSIFTAKKAGSTLVVCGDRRIYYIEVEAVNKNWFASEIYSAFCEKRHRSDITNICSKYKFKEEEAMRQVVIKGVPMTKNVVLEYDDKQNLDKCLFVLDNNNSNKKTIESGLLERMERIKESSPQIEFWIHKHKSEEDYEDSIDNAAFVWSKKNDLIFGLARNWRQKGAVEEFCANTGMFLNSFGTLISSEDLPKILASSDIKLETKPTKEVTEEKLTPKEENVPSEAKSEESNNIEEQPEDINIEDGMAVEFQKEEDEIPLIDINDDVLDDMSSEYDREYDMN